MNRLITAMAFLSITASVAVTGCGDVGNPTNDLTPMDIPGDTIGETVTPDVVPAEVTDDAAVDADGNADVAINSDADGIDGIEDTTPYEDGATARIITTEAELIKGPLATGTIGDILIKNKYVRFIVRTQEIGLFSPFGGNLVDADLVREEGDEGHEKFLELFPMIGFGRALKPEKIEIIDDGAISGKAIVRVTGTDHGLPVIDMVLPTFPLYVSATIDYTLGPDSHGLEMKVTATNTTSYPLDLTIGSVLQFGKRFEKFNNQCGTDSECATGKSNIEWLAAASGDVSFAFSTMEGTNPKIVLAQEEILLTEVAAKNLAANESLSATQYLTVGNGTIDDAATKAWQLRNMAGLRTVNGTVALSENISDIRDIRVSARISGATGNTGWINSSSPDADGKVVLHLPDGTYDLTVELPGTDPDVIGGVTVSESGENTFTNVTNAAGRLHVTINDGGANLVPAGIILMNGFDAPLQNGRNLTAIKGGDFEFPVKAGEYTVLAMKGFEYDIAWQNATITGGETTHLIMSLHHVIETPNQITMISHSHDEHSIDSTILLEDRVHNALASGIDFPMGTDHDYFNNLQPAIEAEGMASLLKSTVGIEISPVNFHTIGMNCKNPPTYPTYFAVRFGDYDDDGFLTGSYTPNQIFDYARNDYQCAYVGVAHPWTYGSLFNFIGMTPEDDPADFITTFDATKINGIEVTNSGQNWADLAAQNLAGWFAFINHGYSVSAMGGSDQHGYTMNYGYPMNLVRTSTDVIADLSVDEVFANINAGHTMVYAGPYITVDIAGAGYGDVVNLTELDGLPAINISVKAPEWMKIEFVKVFANGEIILDQTLEAPPSGTIEVFSDSLPAIDFLTDTYIVVVAGSTSVESTMPGYGRPPFSVTNPIFIDVDGDGWEAPLAD